MRFLAIICATALAGSGCGSPPSAPTSPSAQTSLAGDWVGSASDSTSSMMGTGMTTGMPGSGLESMTWHVTQTGNTFSGTMQLPGHHGGTMTVTGHVEGHTGTFTMTVPSVSMMGGACTATATGTFETDDHMDEMHGTYAGTNTCLGQFDHGHMDLIRR